MTLRERVKAWLRELFLRLDEAEDECSGPDTWTVEDERRLQEHLRERQLRERR